ncbi:hypothetical protein [Candidatus Methylocalor cossyra]|uniref:Uncharacterized protein n=1 Tax=Candidatus Methylocalor cossyra TaxID=3108543 RepID=A0ABM9NE78_9GAMM
MVKALERLAHLLKSPVEAKIARDYLTRKLREDPDWAAGKPAQAGVALAALGPEPESLHAWCAQWLTGDQVRALLAMLRLVSHHQRVYKRTVMLSPRAHLLVKTLAELEDSSMSEVIERHLDRVLVETHGRTLRTLVDERTGLVEHSILPSDALDALE